MTRRGWLRRVPAGVAFLVGQVRRLAHGLISTGWVLQASAGAEEPRRLSPAELDTLVAFGEVVVEGRALTGDARTTLSAAGVEAVDRASDRIGLYRGAAQLLDRLAGREFAGLNLADRTALVTAHRLGLRVAQDEPALSDDARFIRTSLAPELVVEYWRSAAGWAAVGYQTFPGRCGDLARYTRPEP